MPVAGRKPKPEEQRRNRSRPTHDWVEVEDRPFKGGPNLGRRYLRLPWPAATLAWWRTISSMPHCCLWSKADWRFALDTAIVAAAFHTGNLQQAKELRQREKIMGTTVDARRDLRIRYIESVLPEERKGVMAIQEYRDRLAR